MTQKCNRMKSLCDNAMKRDGEPKNTIIFLGNFKKDKQAVNERFDKLIDFGIGKSNFEVGYSDVLYVKCPKSKVKKLLETFPIVEKSIYWQTTHYWEGATI